MPNWREKFSDPIYWYFLVLLVALLAGWYLPGQLVFLADHSTLILGLIFFLGALKIKREDLGRVWHSKKTILLFDFLMLIGLPIIVYVVTRLLLPGYALPLLILAAMPTGMAAPLLAGIVGGRESLAMAMTITTSLLAPFTVPVIIHTLAGVSVDVDFWQMFLSIAQIIFIPFVLAWLARLFLSKTVDKVKNETGHLSTLFLGALVAGIVAQQSAVITQGLATNIVFLSLGIVSVFIALFYLLGFLLYAGETGKDRLTLAVSFANMNFTLAIYLAHRYFPAPEVVIPTTLAVVPWFVCIVFFKYLTQKTVSEN